MFVKQRSSSARTHNNNTASSSNKQKKRIKCSYCKRLGHSDDKCYKKKNDQGQHIAEDEDFFAASSFADKSSVSSISTLLWCIDSGCTTHMCNDINSFTHALQAESGIKLANDATATATATGNIRLTVSSGKQDRTITLSRALHVPSLRTNLMSVAKIVDANNEVFTKQFACIKDNHGSTKFVADRKGDLFFVRESDNTAYECKQVTSSAAEWHRRLGHLNMRDMKAMLKNPVVNGLGLNLNDEPEPCEACTVAKMSTTPYQSREKRVPAILDLIHADLCGPMSTQSFGGAKYFLAFTDDYSRWSEIYFLRKKS